MTLMNAEAITAWQEALGTAHVLTDAAGEYARDTGPFRQTIPVVLLPKSAEEISALARIASQHNIPLYPVSTGHNWGYGTANPVVGGCALVSLARLDRIIELDPEMGLVTLEPGVTQQQLRNHLDEQCLDFLVPVTGAGPDCSLIGNALERGYGITPHADHFGAVTWIEAVLPDGSLYRGALSELGSPQVDQAFKWGMGPYLDGLFTQGAFGIVTKMTIALAPIPKRTEAFFFSLAHDEDLEQAVAAVRDVLLAVGGVGGSINLMNARRVLAMTEAYPHDRVGPASIMADDLVHERAMRYQILPWTGVGALYGETELVKAAKKLVRQRLRHCVRRLVFLTPEKARKAHAITCRLPNAGGRLGKMAEKLDLTLRLLAGEPSQIALPLAYWKSRKSPPVSDMDPGRDGCGLIWYSPLIPMKAEIVRRYVSLVESICRKHGIEPLITLTSLSPRIFDSTVPLLFDPEDTDESARANACYLELFEAGRREGLLPYRMGAQHMNLVTEADIPYWKLVSKLKRAIEPNGMIALGRYCPRHEISE